MARIAPRSVVSVLGAATAPPTWVSGVAITGLRLLVAFLWLWNVFWKVPPDFGEDKRTRLYFWTHLGLDSRSSRRTPDCSNTLCYRTSPRSAGA
jgi:hypothetical protein